MNVLIFSSYFLANVIMQSVLVDSKNLPTDIPENNVDQPAEILHENSIMDVGVSEINQDTVVQTNQHQDTQVQATTSKRKMKKLRAKQNGAVVRSKADQENVFSEMRDIIREVLSNENTYRVFVQMIEYYKETSESPIFLKTVYWIQNGMNVYLAGPKSPNNVRKETQEYLDSYTILPDANEEQKVETGAIISNSEFLAEVDSLITKLIRKRNAEQLAQTKFERIREMLAA